MCKAAKWSQADRLGSVPKRSVFDFQGFLQAEAANAEGRWRWGFPGPALCRRAAPSRSLCLRFRELKQRFEIRREQCPPATASGRLDSGLVASAVSANERLFTSTSFFRACRKAKHRVMSFVEEMFLVHAFESG